MKPSELSLASDTPERALITSRAETREAVLIALAIAKRSVRCLHRDLAIFDLGSVAAEASLHRLLLSHRSARVQLLWTTRAGWKHALRACVPCSAIFRTRWSCVWRRPTTRLATMPACW